MRIHIDDLEHEIAKARHELETLTGKRNEAENALDRPGTVRWLVEGRVREIQAQMDEVEEYLEIIEDPELLEPCTDVARRAGCTCTLTLVSPTDIDPPEPVRSRNCPLHGSEPDEDER